MRTVEEVSDAIFAAWREEGLSAGDSERMAFIAACALVRPPALYRPDGTIVFVAATAVWRRAPTIYHFIGRKHRDGFRMDASGRRWETGVHLTACGMPYSGWEQLDDMWRPVEHGILLRRDHAERFANLCSRCAP